MKKNPKQLFFDMKFEIREKLNDEFTLAKCTVMALEKNRNGSYISYKAAQEAEKSLYNIPIVGHIFKNTEDKWQLGGHDKVLEKDTESGDLHFKSICVPYGVVPADAKIEYKKIEESDGTEKTYLITDVILWTGRFPELFEIMYNDEICCNESVEINILDCKSYEDDPEYLEIKKYTYSALCMLQKADDEKNVEPCFPESKIVIGTENFEKLMSEFKYELFSYYNKMKGGCSDMGMTNEIRDDILKKFELSLEDLTFEISEDMTAEAFEEKIIEMKDFEAKENAMKFSALYLEKINTVAKVLETEYIKNNEGTVVCTVEYFVVDMDDEYVYVKEYQWSNSGKDKETLVRMKYQYNEDDKTAVVDKENKEEMILKMVTLAEDKKIEEERNELEELRDFKNEVLKKEKEAEYDTILKDEAFSMIANTEEFKELKESAYDCVNAETLKTQCYAILGKYSAKKEMENQKKGTFGLKFPVKRGNPLPEDEYDAFYNKYKERK